MAKYKRSEKQLTRRQVARREKEYRAQRLITWIAASLGVVILGILIYGVVTEVFIKARRPVARVGDRVITTQDYRARQTYERWMTEMQVFQYQSYLAQLAAQQTRPSNDDGENSDADTGLDSLIQQLQLQLGSLERQLSPDLAPIFGGQVLDRMIEETLVRQEAAERGLSVSDDRMRQEIGLLLGLNPNPITLDPDTEDATPAAEMEGSMEDFDDIYRQFKTNVLQPTRFDEKDFRDMVRASILRDELRNAMAESVDLQQDQVEIILFSLATEESAEATRDRLTQDNEDPEALAEEFAMDEDPTTSAFSLPWLPAGYLSAQLGREVESVAFNTAVGRTSPVVRGQDGLYYVIYVSGHELRELSEDLAVQAGNQAYELWLTTAKAQHAEYLDWQAALVTR
jgi:parvulin-like peptidyl-prolyl isomerase